jgi:hypothetical protein
MDYVVQMGVPGQAFVTIMDQTDIRGLFWALCHLNSNLCLGATSRGTEVLIDKELGPETTILMVKHPNRVLFYLSSILPR